MPSPLDNGVSRSTLALLYHELRPEPASYSYVLRSDRFTEHLQLFQELRREAPASYQPVLTFDDGHLSNYEQAVPRLLEHGMTAHFFITAGWTGKRTGYMRPEHLRSLHASGQQIGAHGWSHKLLTQCSRKELHHELDDTRRALEDWIDAPVRSMSLPGGRSNARVMDACREAGYTHVWTSVPRAEALPLGGTVGRFNIHADVSDRFLRQLLDPASGVLREVSRRHRLKTGLQRVLGDRVYARLWSLLNHEEVAETAHLSEDEPAFAATSPSSGKSTTDAEAGTPA